LDVLWTMRRRIEVPIAAVTEVRVVRREQAPKPGLRLPGAYIPGVITAGSYGTGDARAFWDVRRAEEVLLIRCKVGSPYRSIVLEFPDPYAVLVRTRTVVSHTV
jgi:hypothetical protein